MIKYIMSLVLCFHMSCKVEIDGSTDKEDKEKKVEEETTPPPSVSTKGAYLLIEKERLLSLPTTGAEWKYLKEKADEAVAVKLEDKNNASPWMTNYNDRGDGQRLPAKYLAAALVYASSFDGEKESYRKAVEDGIRFVIGTEEELSTDGTDKDDALLSTCRQLAAWVMAADLIGFDRNLKGTRTTKGRLSDSNWQEVSFEFWLKSIVDKKVSDHSRWTKISETQEDSASNWAAHCTAARVATTIYLNDTAQLEKTIKIMKGFLGDQESYPTLRPSGDWDEVGIIPSGAFDSSWACNYKEEKNGWKPINSSECGPEMDGIMVDDISRSAGSYPNFDPKGISYSLGALQGLYLSAVLLNRQGYNAFDWSNKALKRAMEWLNRNNQIPSYNDENKGYANERHVPWLANYFYGLSLPTKPANVGRSLGYTDWLFPPKSN